MEIVHTVAELHEVLAGRKSGSVGFVPTMGALHRGHISLVTCARKECDTVVVSVFVNPTQFNDPNDLRSYPRTPEKDAGMLSEAGADIVFMPAVEEMYPEPDTRVFDFGDIDKVMEGASRPGHFNGVGQVVSRLFDMVKPDRAYFGEKDFQQIAVIKALVAQMKSDVTIVECPIIREDDGLAMSSRNELLTAEYRTAAPAIYAALRKGVEASESNSVAEVEKLVIREVEAGGLLRVVYFQIVDALTLQQVSEWSETKSMQGCIAVQAGSVRLIDNIRFR